jgi:hypothetical protein
MIENRSRIEKQILLGRQVGRQSYRGRSSALGAEASLTKKNKPIYEQTKATAATSSANSGFEVPLSADTDAEAAFARRPPFKRRHSSKHLSSNRTEDPNASNPPRRLSRLKHSPEGNELDPMDVLSTKVSNSEYQYPSFFSKLGAKSLSKLSLSFSSDRRAAMDQSTGNLLSPSSTTTTQSSSEEYYNWDVDQNPDEM